MIILHFGIPDIIQFDNDTEFNEEVIFFWVKYSIIITNGQPQTLRTQRLVE